MADNRTVSGSVDVSHDDRFAAAFKLMETIGNKEYASKEPEQRSRDYWLQLYVDCVNATYRNLPKR